MLTERERQVLADLESELSAGDPKLAARLAGTGRDRLYWQWRRWRPVAAACALPSGCAFMLATFTVSPWLGASGVVGMFWGSLVHLPRAEAPARRVWARIAGARRASS